MKRLISIVLAAAILIVGCGKKSDFSGELSFAGSSTLAPVVAAISDELKASNKTWKDINADFADKEIVVNVATGGSGAGVKAIQEKTADFGMLARGLKDTESSIEGLVEHKIGIDALTISVNPENTITKLVDSLSKDDIKKFFSGEYKKWSDFDPSLPDEEIVVVTRDLGGGAHEVFQKKIMGDDAVREDAIQAPSMGALVQKVIENKNAIGYASYGVSKQNEGKLFPIKVDGVAASEETILDGSYIISRPLIIVHIGELTGEAKYFMDFVESERGKEILTELGFVPSK